MSSGPEPAPDGLVWPLLAEELSVARRQILGDTVRASTVTREIERLVEADLTHHRVEVERVPIGRPVDSVPAVRTEGDTTVIPVVEETVVVERRLILKEEVRIRRVSVTEHHRETVVVREQDAVITRTPAGAPDHRETGEPSGNDPTNRNLEQMK